MLNNTSTNYKIITIYIKSTFNNTIINIFNYKKMIFCKSCGNKNIKGFQRHNLYAIQNLMENIKFFLNNQNIKHIKIYFKGINYKNYYIIKSLSNFNIKKIINKTSIPHNGCKIRKKKRR